MRSWCFTPSGLCGTQPFDNPVAPPTMKNALLLKTLTALICLLAGLAAAAQQVPDQTVLIKLLRDEASAYEHGDGVERDGPRAADLYCKAARLGDAQSQFNLGWLYTNGRGVERSEATAAFFFNAAAEQGFEQARRMLATVGGPPAFVPDCMLPPAPPAQSVKQAAASRARTAVAATKAFSPSVDVTSRKLSTPHPSFLWTL